MKEYKRGKNNPTVGMTPEEVTNYWVNESIKKFGDKFDYSKVGIIKIKKDKTLIGCTIHGYRETSFFNHLNSATGCFECGDAQCRKSKRHTYEDIITEIDNAHPNRDFKILSRKLTTSRIKTEKFYVQDKFGICLVSVSSLILGGRPSIKTACFKNLYVNNILRYTLNYNLVSFPNLDYKCSLKLIDAHCHLHGDFKTKPNWVMSSKRGCPTCGNNRGYLKGRDTQKQYLKKVLKIHGQRYDYSKLNYTTAHESVNIICKTHGEFCQVAYVHLQGSGCPECACENSGYGRSEYVKTAKGRDASLYLLKCFNENEYFYKVGITVTTIKERYSRGVAMPYNYEIVYQFKGEAGSIWDSEKSILRTFKPQKYAPLTYFPGYTECFNIDLSIEDVKNHITENFNTFNLHSLK